MKNEDNNLLTLGTDIRLWDTQLVFLFWRLVSRLIHGVERFSRNFDLIQLWPQNFNATLAKEFSPLYTYMYMMGGWVQLMINCITYAYLRTNLCPLKSSSNFSDLLTIVAVLLHSFIIISRVFMIAYTLFILNLYLKSQKATLITLCSVKALTLW